ncbi:hypothetical protein COCNU_16G002610 [Cocos nucifera]|uniref:DUF4005 domain-containing protein n=1 Tax=Cocos nucifera TaxID=13894 RepID=A0A8K0NDW7_COCNU|nr:hypothetical protein COCNU_16G002610 [Cocos nucifera]
MKFGRVYDLHSTRPELFQGIPTEGFASSAASTTTPSQVRPNFTSSSPPRKPQRKGAKKPSSRKSWFDRVKKKLLSFETKSKPERARRALRALKGLVRLQALVRGQAVRRKTAITLRGLQSLMKIQSLTCASRVRIAEDHQACDGSDLVHRKPRDIEDIKTMLQESNERRWEGSIFSKEEVDAMQRSRRQATAKARESNRICISPSDSDNKDKAEETQLRYLARRSFSRSGRASTRDDGSFSTSPSFPNYMASTASAKARFR